MWFIVCDPALCGSIKHKGLTQGPQHTESSWNSLVFCLKWQIPSTSFPLDTPPGRELPFLSFTRMCRLEKSESRWLWFHESMCRFILQSIFCIFNSLIYSSCPHQSLRDSEIKSGLVQNYLSLLLEQLSDWQRLSVWKADPKEDATSNSNNPKENHGIKNHKL